MKHYTLEEYIAENNWCTDFEYLNSNGELDSVYITDKYVSCNNNEATEILKKLQSQGFDEYSNFEDEDKEIMQTIVDDLNKISFSKAKENEKTVYRHYSLGTCSGINKCSDVLLYHLLKHEDYEVNPGHGGKRQGAGRKSQYRGGTTLLRVPKYEKDECRQLIDFLVDMQSKGSPVYAALSRVIRDAESYIEMFEKTGIDMSEDRKRLEIIKNLEFMIPNFSIAKE